MKQMLILTIFFLGITNLKSQNIVPYNSSEINTRFFTNGDYYKDTTGALDYYAGTWQYTNGNQKFQLILTKVIMYHRSSYNPYYSYYYDGVKVKYKLFTNNVLTFESSGEFTEFPSLTLFENNLTGTFQDHQRGNFIAKASITKEGTTKIRFSLDNFEAVGQYHKDNPNEPFYSVPNDVVMTKVGTLGNFGL